MLALNAGAQQSLEAAIAHDAGFALAHIALARWFQYAGDMPQAQASKARALACLDGVSRRERQHVTALAKAVDGDGPGALAFIYEHLQEFPRDAFVLKQEVAATDASPMRDSGVHDTHSCYNRLQEQEETRQ